MIDKAAAIKRLRKFKDQLDKLNEKEDDLLNQIDDTIEELIDDGGGGF